MPLDGFEFERSPYGSPWCRACKQPIGKHQPATRIEFQTDPHGAKGLTGDYHVDCGKRFRSLARVVNLNPGSSW